MLERFLRVETESREVVIQNHLERVNRLEGELSDCRNLIREGRYDTGYNVFNRFDDILGKLIDERVKKLPGKRRLIVLGHTLNLPPVKY